LTPGRRSCWRRARRTSPRAGPAGRWPATRSRSSATSPTGSGCG
jgi:hypothetical protein